jgi:tetratricopeptide (TPR) repeat protein
VNKIKILLLLFFIANSSFGQERSCREVLAIAESFLMDGNTDNVKKILNQTRSTCKDDVNWYYIQFGYQSEMNEVDSSNYYMIQAVKLFPKNDSIYFLAAQTFLFYYDSLAAINGLKYIEKAISLKKKSQYQLCNAQLLHAANYLDLALEIVQAIPNGDQNYEVLVEWGALLNELNKPKEGLKKFNQAIALDKHSPAAYLQKADLLFNKFNKQDEAMAALDTVEMIDSSLADPMLIRASFFENKNDFDNAISEYDQAIQTDSSIHQVYIFRGTCLKEIKEYDLAEEDYKKYKTMYPAERDINYLLADLYIAKGDYNAAALLMSQMETKGENAYELYLMRGIAYNNNGQYDNALADFNKAEKYPERDVDLYYNRGLCYFNKEDYRKAKYDFEMAKNNMPDNMEFHYLHCRAAYHAGHFDDACQSCNTAKFHNYEPIDNMYLKNCK